MKDKIRKLLALASDPNASDGERDNASRMAARLMAKHDIDLADLEEEALKAQFDLIRGEAVGCRPGKRNAKEVPPWIGIIAWGIKCYTRTRVSSRGGVVYFRGPREDVELAQWLQGILVEGAYKSSKGQPNPNAYRNGYASAIQGRLKKMVREREQVESSEPNQFALVRVQDARQKAMDEAYGPESRGKSSGVKSSADGYNAGLSAAIPSGRPVSQSYLRLN